MLSFEANPSVGICPRTPMLPPLAAFLPSVWQTLTVAHSIFDRSALAIALRIWAAVGPLGLAVRLACAAAVVQQPSAAIIASRVHGSLMPTNLTIPACDGSRAGA